MSLHVMKRATNLKPLGRQKAHTLPLTITFLGFAGCTHPHTFFAWKYLFSSHSQRCPKSLGYQHHQSLSPLFDSLHRIAPSSPSVPSASRPGPSWSYHPPTVAAPRRHISLPILSTVLLNQDGIVPNLVHQRCFIASV